MPLTEEAAARRRREILDAAVRLIVDRGFQATSMREIAAAAGAGKSTLYDYFQTKEQILIIALDEAMGDLNERARTIAALALPPDERLRQIMALHLAVMQADNGLLVRLGQEAQFLNTSQLTHMATFRRVYQDVVCGLIREGIEQGLFRKVDALVAARMLVNALITPFYTTRPTGTVAEMMDEVVGIFMRGIAK